MPRSKPSPACARARAPNIRWDAAVAAALASTGGRTVAVRFGAAPPLPPQKVLEARARQAQRDGAARLHWTVDAALLACYRPEGGTARPPAFLAFIGAEFLAWPDAAGSAAADFAAMLCLLVVTAAEKQEGGFSTQGLRRAVRRQAKDFGMKGLIVADREEELPGEDVEAAIRGLGLRPVRFGHATSTVATALALWREHAVAMRRAMADGDGVVHWTASRNSTAVHALQHNNSLRPALVAYRGRHEYVLHGRTAVQDLARLLQQPDDADDGLCTRCGKDVARTADARSALCMACCRARLCEACVSAEVRRLRPAVTRGLAVPEQMLVLDVACPSPSCAGVLTSVAHGAKVVDRCCACGAGLASRRGCVCAGCGMAAYCSRDCQAAGWAGVHKALCKHLRTRLRV